MHTLRLVRNRCQTTSKVTSFLMCSQYCAVIVVAMWIDGQLEQKRPCHVLPIQVMSTHGACGRLFQLDRFFSSGGSLWLQTGQGRRNSAYYLPAGHARCGGDRASQFCKAGLLIAAAVCR